MSFLVENEVRVFSLKRGGTNALAFWVWDCFEKKYDPSHGIFFRNTDFTLQVQKAVYGALGSNKRLRTLVKNNHRGYKVWYVVNTIENYNLAVLKHAEEDKDHPYNRVKSLCLEQFSEKKGFSKKVYNVIVLRSPHNHLASLFKIVGDDQRYRIYYMTMILGFEKMWTQYAKEFISETNYVENKIPILYDRWFTDREYREEICGMFGLPLPYEGLSAMAVRSSFDGYDYKKDPSMMKVFDRWKVYRDNEIFCSILKDRQLRKYYETIFDKKLCV